MVIAIDDPVQANRLAHELRQSHPQLRLLVVARARHERHFAAVRSRHDKLTLIRYRADLILPLRAGANWTQRGNKSKPGLQRRSCRVDVPGITGINAHE